MTGQSPLVLILLGPPGSGKGTQAIKLSQKWSVPHVSTGDLFREHIRQQTALGQEADKYISQGRLVPDGLTLDMLFHRVNQPDCAPGYLLDGVPRTIHQAEVLDQRLLSSHHLIVLNLRVADSEIIRRVVGRLTCKVCGYIQHQEFSPPKVSGVCDQCGGELFQRPDDTERLVRERLTVYHRQTEPVIEYYAKRGVLSEVDGQKPPHQVFESLCRVVTHLTHREWQ